MDGGAHPHLVLHSETRSSQDQLAEAGTYTCHVTSGRDKKSASIKHEGEGR